MAVMTSQNRFYGLVEVDSSTLKADEQGNPVPVEIEILRAGDWSNTPNHGSFKVSTSDLDEYVENFNKNVRKAIPIDVEHRTDPVYGKRAVGWMQGLKRAGDSLIGTIEWTKTGLGLLQDKAYKFFSPEFAPAGYKDPEGKLSVNRNVLVAGALVNRPLMKGLRPVIASDGSGNELLIYADEGDNLSMTLDEIRKKALADLTEDDKTFIKEHKAELTDAEQTAYGVKEGTAAPIVADKPVATPAPAPAPVAASDTPIVIKADDGTSQTISADEFNALKLAADRGDKAYEQMQKKDNEQFVDGLIRADDGSDGSFKPGAKDKLLAFVESLSGEQRKVFASDVVPNISQQAAAVEMGRSYGQSVVVSASGEAAADALTAKAEAIMASEEGKGMRFNDALKRASAENPDLLTAYNKSITSEGGEV